MGDKIHFKMIKNPKIKKHRICGKFFKKLSEQPPTHGEWLCSTIFFGNRYDRRRFKFLLSLLFDDIQGKPILYSSGDSRVLTPEKVTDISYNTIDKQYYFIVKCTCFHYVAVVISKELWHELIHLKNKYCDLKFETDLIGNEHLVKQQIGSSCLNCI